MSVKFPVEMRNNYEGVSQRLSNTGHNSTELLYAHSFIILFSLSFFFFGFIVCPFFLSVPLLAHVKN